MRKFLLVSIFIFISIPQIFSQKEIRLREAKDFSFELLKNQKQGFQAVQKTGHLYITPKKTKSGTFSEIRTNKLMKTFRKGYPDLPVVSKLIEIPVGANINVKIISYDLEVINLNKRGIKNKLAPAQPSQEKFGKKKHDKFYINQKIYNTNIFFISSTFFNFNAKGDLNSRVSFKIYEVSLNCNHLSETSQGT